MLSEKLIVLANNTEKVFNAGYNKCLKENPPGASEEELEAKYQKGYSDGSAAGYSDGYDDGYLEGSGDLEHTANRLHEIIAIQETYLEEDISIYIMSMVDYDYKEIICKSTDTWADVIANDYNGIVSSCSLVIGDGDYVRYYYNSGSYLYGNNGSYCKANERPVANVSYMPNGINPE